MTEKKYTKFNSGVNAYFQEMTTFFGLIFFIF